MTVLDPQSCVRLLDNSVESSIKSNSYDLRVGRVFEIHGGIEIYADGTRVLPPYREATPYTDTEGREMYCLRPSTLYQIESIESIHLPDDVCAISLMRSSMHKSGASGEAGLYDSGYEGTCGMTVSVSQECLVEKSASLFQLVFFRSETSSLYSGQYLDSQWVDRLLEEG